MSPRPYRKPNFNGRSQIYSGPRLQKPPKDRFVKRYTLSNEELKLIREHNTREKIKNLDDESAKLLLSIHVKQINRALAKIELEKERTTFWEELIKREEILKTAKMSVMHATTTRTQGIPKTALIRFIEKELPKIAMFVNA